jgi:hypothetical protein
VTPEEIGARLEPGQPPLRVGELAELVGYSERWVQKLMDEKILIFVQVRPGTERRVPVEAAARLAAQLRLIASSAREPLDDPER